MQLIKIPKVKKTYLDVIKIIAVAMVVFNHTGNAGYMRYLDVMDAPAHQLLMGYSVLIMTAVPLFFMASGALLLKKEEPYGIILRKRVLRFALILVIVSFFYYYEAYGQTNTFSLTDFLLHLYKGDLSWHLWYLYSYLCYMLLLPILRKLAQMMKKQDYILLIVVFLISELFSAADYALFRGTATHTYHISFFVAQKYVIYPLLGYYIDQHMNDKHEETFYVLAVLSVVSVYITCALMDWRYGLDGSWTSANQEAYMDRMAVIPAMFIFFAVKRLFNGRKLNEKVASVLFVLGSCTFGVYLFDPKWREFTHQIRVALIPTLGVYWATHVQTICACGLGMIATFAFKCGVGSVKLLAVKAEKGLQQRKKQKIE